MESAFNRRLFVVWLVLVGITLTYLWIDHAGGVGGPRASTAVTVAAIVLALVKVRIIMREFMEVRHAPAPLCLLTDLLVVVMGAAMLATYGAGRALS
ncbi:MAG TPA: cytochrome C oxidase subunit IV family protein [Acidimicrobiales bacterium]|nr:cytochrome C oxidase subunit IV family protein [Acidimicrobiales bacterium]